MTSVISRFRIFTTPVRLRDLNEDVQILLLNPIASSEELRVAAERRITITISSARQVSFVNEYCLETGASVSAHVEIDTGMGRYGFMPEEFSQLYDLYKTCEKISITGIYSHIYNVRNKKQTNRQILCFSSLLQQLKSAGIEPGTAHLASSAVLFEYPQALFDAVRIGSAFTGRLNAKDKHGLLSAGEVESEISEIRTLISGHNVGYGGVFKVRRKTRAAVIPVGYLSGIGLENRPNLFRLRDFIVHALCEFKNLVFRKRTCVQIDGAWAPVLGRICTNHLVVDVTDIDCGVGTKVSMDGNPMFCGNLLNVEYR